MNKARQTAVLGMFTALIVVLQLMSYFIKIGTFNLSLVLIPLVLGAILYGPEIGAVLGGVFGAVVTVCSIAGLDSGGFVLWSAGPFLTALVCMVKGIAAGFAAGLIAGALKGSHRYLGCVLAAMAAPVVNTGIFCAGMALFFRETLIEWAAGSAVPYYMITGLIGVNFLIEFTVNTVCSPAIVRIADAVKKSAGQP